MRQHRALRIIIALSLFAGCIGYALWWRSVAARIEAQSSAWIDARRAEGWTIETGPLAVGGFPFGWRLDAGAVRIARIDGSRAEARSLFARAAPWSPGRVRVVGDAVTVTLPPGATRPTGTLTAAHGEALLAEENAITLDDLSWRAEAATPVDGKRAKLTWQQQRVTLSLTALHLPGASPLGDTLQSLELACTAEPALPPGADAASMQRWRDDGGVLQVGALHLEWGKLSLTGEGTAALDAQGRVELAGTARIAGWSETIDALVAAGSVKPNGAALAKAGLSLLAKPKDGAAKETGDVTVAVAIQGGQLYLGGIRLGAAPPLKIF